MEKNSFPIVVALKRDSLLRNSTSTHSKRLKNGLCKQLNKIEILMTTILSV